MKPSNSFYFIVASWVLCVVSWILLVCSFVVLDVPTDTVAAVLVAIALIIPLPIFFLTLRIRNDFREWALHTMGTLFMVALIAIAMSLWVGTAYDACVRESFVEVSNYALIFAVMWLVYGLVNMVCFMLSVSERDDDTEANGTFLSDLFGIIKDIDAIEEADSGRIPPKE